MQPRQPEGGVIEPNVDDVEAMLDSNDGLPVYAAIGPSWISKKLCLDPDHRCIYVLDADKPGNPDFWLEVPSFYFKDLRRFLKSSQPGRHILTLEFEEGMLMFRFSYLSMLDGLVEIVSRERVIPLVVRTEP